MDGFQLSSGYCAVETEQGIKRCTFTWNNKRFKDPADWFAQMVKRGIIVSPNIKPGMLLVHPLLEEMKAKDMFLPASDDNAGVDGLAVGTWWGGPGLFVDFTKQSTREHWKQYSNVTWLVVIFHQYHIFLFVKSRNLVGHEDHCRIPNHHNDDP